MEFRSIEEGIEILKAEMYWKEKEVVLVRSLKVDDDGEVPWAAEGDWEKEEKRDNGLSELWDLICKVYWFLEGGAKLKFEEDEKVNCET